MRPVSFNLLFLRTIDPLNFFFTSYSNPTSDTVITINGTMIPSCQTKKNGKSDESDESEERSFFMRMCRNIVLINYVVENYLPKIIKKNKGFLVDLIFPSSLVIVQLKVAFSYPSLPQVSVIGRDKKVPETIHRTTKQTELLLQLSQAQFLKVEK